MRASFWATLRTLSFHISCAVSAVIAVFETAITAITAVYVFVFFSKQANPHNRFFFYRLCRFASLSYILITSLPRTSYTLSLALFHMSVEMTCRVMENSIYSLDINIISRISTLSWLHSVLYQIVGVEISTIQFQCA